MLAFCLSCRCEISHYANLTEAEAQEHSHSTIMVCGAIGGEHTDGPVDGHPDWLCLVPVSLNHILQQRLDFYFPY